MKNPQSPLGPLNEDFHEYKKNKRKSFHTAGEWVVIIAAGIVLGLLMSWLEIREVCSDCWWI
jgi:hypothetical protein|tara:strand:+ start:123 stop:308 length:186 start_codon:yes stop_codon:yes gene_type:complete